MSERPPLDDALRLKHRKMILSPERWPQFILPIKRYRDGDMETAIVRSSVPDAPIRIETNSTIFGPLGEVTKLEYPSVDALLDDGWEVD